MIRSLFLSVWAVVIQLYCPTSHAEQDFVFYTYHDKPPYFIQGTPSPSGIYQTIIDGLNIQQSELNISLQYIPRQRLNQKISEATLEGAVIGVNPYWFKDPKKNRFLWSDSIMKDKDLFVMKRDAIIPAVADDGKYDFSNKIFALTSGAYYKGISEQAEQGSINVIDTKSAQQSISLITHKRVDVGILSEATINFYKIQSLKLKALPISHDEFDRFIMFPKHLNLEYSIVQSALSATQLD